MSKMFGKLFLTIFALFGFVFLFANLWTLTDGYEVVYTKVVGTPYYDVDITYTYFGFSSFKLMVEHWFKYPIVKYFTDFNNLGYVLSLPTQIADGTLQVLFWVFLTVPYYLTVPIAWLVALVLSNVGVMLGEIVSALLGFYNLTHTMHYRMMPLIQPVMPNVPIFM